jgi:hypothetical protein
MVRIAKTLKNDLSTLKQSCVGKKMKGFKFADCKSANWEDSLEDFIGQEGEIIAYNEAWNYFTVIFPKSKENWAYPATKALKHIVEEPKVVEKNVLEESELENAEAHIRVLVGTVANLEERLDAAFKEQEQMLEELREWINAFPGAFTKLVKHAGQITEEDVIYHTGIVLRVMEHKFGYKPKTEEL